jgi:nicotinate phosphoribosyltransferase
MIIESLLDQDFYKFTMAQAVLHRFPDFRVRYRFACRSRDVAWTQAMLDEMNAELDGYCALSFRKEELDFLSSIRFLKPYFIEFLSLYRPKRENVRAWLEADAAGRNELRIEISGPWFLTIHFEMPVLSIVNEVYFRHTSDFAKIEAAGRERLAAKIALAREEAFPFSEFGTRRRYSRGWQEYVAGRLAAELPPEIYTGSSNVLMSMRLGTRPIGTMAHEFIQAGQAAGNVTLADSQRFMLQAWVDEYRGDLGIALSDTLGTDKFLADFDLYFAKLYDGVRHDSGDPFAWGERMLAHYRSLKIDPRTKSFVFSDSLDFPKAAGLWRRFREEARVSFGIGTSLTNDFPGVKPLSIVVKMVECNGRPVAKLSDDPGKTMCEDQGYLDYLRRVTAR